MPSPLFAIALAFSLGIFASSGVHSEPPVLLGATSSFLMAAWIAFARRQASLAFWLSLLAFAGLGVLASSLHEASYGPEHLRTLARKGVLDLSEPCRITGVCSKGSIPRGIGEQIELSVERIENRFSTFATQGKVRLALYYQKGETPKQPLLNPGDRVEVLANLRLPKNFNNPGQFDYVAYLQRQGVALAGTVKNELLVTRLARDQGGVFERQVWRWRRSLQLKLERLFEGSPLVLAVMKALLLGDKQALNPQVEEKFRATGLYHVLVISGQHIAIMAAFLYGLFKLFRLPRPLTVAFTMAGLAFYGAITEAQPSVVRAALMACVFLLVLQFDRDRNLLNSLSLAAGCLLWLDPFWLFDPGFQLSFLAVLAIAIIAVPLLCQITLPWRTALWQIEDPTFDAHLTPQLADFRIWLRWKIETLERFVPDKSWNLRKWSLVLPFRLVLYLAELFIVSLSIQLVFLVLMVLFFHRVSLVSFLLNLLAVPLVGLLVPLGFLLLLGSVIGLPLGLPLTWSCQLLVEILVWLAEYFSAPIWGNFRLPTPPAWLWATYFLCLILALLPVLRWVRGVGAGMAAAALAFLMFFPFSPRTPAGSLQLTFLDVRQGDSIFLSFPDQSTMVIDGGGLLGRSFGEHFGEERFDVGEEVVSPYLWSLGVRRLDAVVLTHAHHDHMSGLEALLTNFKVGELWVGQNPLVPEYLELLKTSLRNSVPIRSFAADDAISFHASQIEFLNPAQTARPAKTAANNDSLAFRLQFKERRFLLTGDIERRVESEILAKGERLKSDLLKVAHHGSRSSTLPEFLDQVKPLWAVISVAEHSPFGHPHAEVLQRLRERNIPVFRTDRHGAVTVTTDGSRLEVQCYMEGRGSEILR